MYLNGTIIPVFWFWVVTVVVCISCSLPGCDRRCPFPRQCNRKHRLRNFQVRFCLVAVTAQTRIRTCTRTRTHTHTDTPTRVSWYHSVWKVLPLWGIYMFVRHNLRHLWKIVHIIQLTAEMRTFIEYN